MGRHLVAAALAATLAGGGCVTTAATGGSGSKVAMMGALEVGAAAGMSLMIGQVDNDPDSNFRAFHWLLIGAVIGDVGGYFLAKALSDE